MPHCRQPQFVVGRVRDLDGEHFQLMAVLLLQRRQRLVQDHVAVGAGLPTRTTRPAPPARRPRLRAAGDPARSVTAMSAAVRFSSRRPHTPPSAQGTHGPAAQFMFGRQASLGHQLSDRRPTPPRLPTVHRRPARPGKTIRSRRVQAPRAVSFGMQQVQDSRCRCFSARTR